MNIKKDSMKNSIITAALAIGCLTMTAQQLPLSSQYYANPFVFNPAFTGTQGATRAFLTHRSQWTGIAGAPQTSFLTVDGPIEDRNIGLGLKIFSDATDIISRVGATANYSYRLIINDDNNVVFGLGLGVVDNRIDFSKVVVRDTEDPFLFNTVQHKTVFSADFGLAYNWRKLEIGVAVPQLLGNKIRYKNDEGDNSYYRLERQYLGTVKYVFDVIPEKEITAYPLIMARYTPGSVLQYDINAVIDWKKIGWFGVTYHSNYAVALSAGLRYKNLSVGYAYDLGIGKIKSYTGSSSELLLSYTFGARQQSAPPVETTRNVPARDSLTEAAIAKMKVQADSNEARLARMQSELDKLKNGESRSESLTENLMRTGSSNDFVDENGMGLNSGFYVVVGTFSSKANADKFKDANIIKGYNGTAVIQNHKSKVYYVYVKRSETQPEAEAEQQKYKTEYPDVWIQKLE
jgi:type IX secretion system PorP/SprF family membrane protein